MGRVEPQSPQSYGAGLLGSPRHRQPGEPFSSDLVTLQRLSPRVPLTPSLGAGNRPHLALVRALSHVAASVFQVRVSHPD